jgi:cytochrome c biogenesis factor
MSTPYLSAAITPYLSAVIAPYLSAVIAPYLSAVIAPYFSAAITPLISSLLPPVAVGQVPIVQRMRPLTVVTPVHVVCVSKRNGNSARAIPQNRKLLKSKSHTNHDVSGGAELRIKQKNT